jgi:polar amino acid transport system substrate-binding protein
LSEARTVKRTLVWILGCWALLGAGAQAGEMQRIMDKGVVVVSLNRGTPPFCLEVQGKTVGIDVDLARLVAEQLGVEVRFVFPEVYADQIPRLLAGQSDIVIAAMTMTPERGLQVNFTDPYFEVSQAALVRRNRVPEDARSYFDLVDIPSLRIGVKQATTIERFARELFPPDRIKTFPTHEEAVAALLVGAVEATVHDSPFVRFWEKAHRAEAGKVRALLAPTTTEHYGFAIRKGDADFLQWLNLFIAQVQKDGTLAWLTHRYLVEMAWQGGTVAGAAPRSQAQWLYQRHMFQKQEQLERRRREDQKAAGAPY